MGIRDAIRTPNFGKILILIGASFLAAGLVWLGAERLGLGKLPGDIAIKGEHWSFYFPLTTCLLLSAIISLLWRLIRWWRG